jgi:hypothetical protein
VGGSPQASAALMDMLKKLVAMLTPLESTGAARRIVAKALGPVLSFSVEGCDRVIQLIHVPAECTLEEVRPTLSSLSPDSM